jgi:glycerophosphoryl diester phosphodiesterase
VEIYAHRGCSGLYPENTMPAFQAAGEIEVDGIELDVQMTKDGEIVVIHDETIDRTTNGIGYVKDFFYKQLRLFDAGSWFHPQFHHTKIPALVEVLDWLKSFENNITLNIELKNGQINYQGLEEKVLQLVYDYSLSTRVVFSSFNINSLYRLRRLDSSARLALLVEKVVPSLVEHAKDFKAEAIHCDISFASSLYSQRASICGMDIRLYTVNDIKMFNDLPEMNVDAIMSDFPERFLPLRK